MIRVGITGGIGSGKSTACKVFEVLGIPVYYADDEAKKILDAPQIFSQLKETFGEGIINDSGNTDRKKLAAIVFNDKEKLALLNKIVHPAVGQHFEDWCAAHASFSYVLKEAAILFESGAYKQVNKIITVTASPEIRIKRVIARDQIRKEEVEKRMLNQMDDQEKIKRSDFVILNNEEQLMIPQILEIHKQLSIDK